MPQAGMPRMSPTFIHFAEREPMGISKLVHDGVWWTKVTRIIEKIAIRA
jgi:hypothetical protein